jgi:hypothetical protein
VSRKARGGSTPLGRTSQPASFSEFSVPGPHLQASRTSRAGAKRALSYPNVAGPWARNQSSAWRATASAVTRREERGLRAQRSWKRDVSEQGVSPNLVIAAILAPLEAPPGRQQRLLDQVLGVLHRAEGG